MNAPFGIFPFFRIFAFFLFIIFCRLFSANKLAKDMCPADHNHNRTRPHHHTAPAPTPRLQVCATLSLCLYLYLSRSLALSVCPRRRLNMPNLWLRSQHSLYAYLHSFGSCLYMCPLFSFPLFLLLFSPAELLPQCAHQLSHQFPGSWRRTRPRRRRRRRRRPEESQWCPERIRWAAQLYELNGLVGDTDERDACATVCGWHAHNDRRGAAAAASALY